MSDSSMDTQGIISGWVPDPTEKRYTSNKIYLVAGKKLKVRVLDKAPVRAFLHFGSMGRRPVVCPQEGCPLCLRGENIATMWYINVLDREDDKVKVLEFKDQVREKIEKLMRELQKTAKSSFDVDPRYFDLVLLRTGNTQNDTRYEAAKDGESDKGLPDDMYNQRHDIGKVVRPMSVSEMRTRLGITESSSTKISGTVAANQSGIL